MKTYKTFIKEVILLNPGKWGIVMDFVLEEKQLLGKELLVDYDETDRHQRVPGRLSDDRDPRSARR